MSPRNSLQYLLVFPLLPACAGPDPESLAEEPEFIAEDVSAIARRCEVGSDCAGGLGCVQGVCSPCNRHAHCASGVCDLYQGGRCIPEKEVLYVGRASVSHYEECDDATGVRHDPFCQIRDAIPALGNGKTVIRVAPGFYLPFHVSHGEVFSVYGPAGEGGIAQVTEEDVGGLSVRGGARVVLDGLELGRYSHSSGLRCEGPGTRVVVRRSQIFADTRAPMHTNGCDLRLEHTEVLTRD
ncbi:hypothetical protein [Polyangium sp. y55x31]|uniref:hypothetical protein n=1 Tax=Polyangium sp. y55x31 TaxID=3042688 RepID=UPI002482D6C2|nr:hypothetical protein [Polyangium sp. y55x31]MDI1478392.1 hypothetical protein [Polyangium sp. y55x31]